MFHNLAHDYYISMKDPFHIDIYFNIKGTSVFS